MKNFIVGASLGLGGIEAVLTDAEFNILEKQERPYPGHLGKESLAAKLEKTISSLSGYHQAKAVGVALPAVFSPDNKKILASTIEELTGANFFQLLSKKINLPIFILRRNFCAMLAEQAFGAAKVAKNAVLVEIGRDIDASFLFQGKIYKGSNSAAGQLAEVILDITREKRNGAGDFGALISGEGIEALTGKSVYQILKENPKSELLNQQILRDLKESLLTEFFNLKKMLDPELFIINGDIIENFQVFKGAFADLDVKVVKSPLGKTAPALGAAIATYNQMKKS
jgi:glucokinase